MQLELTEGKLPVKDVLKEFIPYLESAWVHLLEAIWSNWMQKVHVNISAPDAFVCQTDFSTKVDLRAAKTDNCSIYLYSMISETLM